jgi:hypothetical protein
VSAGISGVLGSLIGSAVFLSFWPWSITSFIVSGLLGVAIGAVAGGLLFWFLAGRKAHNGKVA